MLTSCIRTAFLYLILILAVRLMGKRQIGQMEPAEFVVTMLIANLAAIPMEELERPLYHGVIPIFTVLAVQLLLALGSLRWVRFRRLLCGKPVILIAEGKILRENLRRTRITLDELTEQLRQKNVLDITQVQYAILETNGILSVFPFAQYAPASAAEAGIQVKPQHLPITIISDGQLLRENLTLAQVDEAWLHRVLQQQRCSLPDTMLLTVDGAGKICHIPLER